MPQSSTRIFRSWARSIMVLRFVFRSSGGETTKTVVGAERDDQHFDLAIERPLEPTQPAGRGVARHTHVHHPVAVAGAIELLLEQRRIGVGGRSRPRPAVRLSPSTTIRGRASASGSALGVAAGDADPVAAPDGSDDSRSFVPVPHAAAPRPRPPRRECRQAPSRTGFARKAASRTVLPPLCYSATGRAGAGRSFTFETRPWAHSFTGRVEGRCVERSAGCQSRCWRWP